MGKYIQVVKSTWEEYLTYRLNFLLWRVRIVMQVLVSYFLWSAIFMHSQSAQPVFGFSRSYILTYIVLSGLVRTFVLGTTTIEIGTIINKGDLSNFLIRPLNFFMYYVARDTADKLMNLCFGIVEVALMFVLLRPDVLAPANPSDIIYSGIALLIGMFIYFNFSLVLGFLGFWTPDIWAPRFLSFVVIEFFAGGLFPLDILPKPLFIISRNLPFSYFIYFPLNVFLGKISQEEITMKLFMGLLWGIIFWVCAYKLWKRGLVQYAAEGK